MSVMVIGGGGGGGDDTKRSHLSIILSCYIYSSS